MQNDKNVIEDKNVVKDSVSNVVKDSVSNVVKEYPKIEKIPAYTVYRADCKTLAVHNLDEGTWAYIYCTLTLDNRDEHLDDMGAIPYAIFDTNNCDIKESKYIPEGETVIISNIPSGLYLWHDTDVEIERRN